VGEVAGGCKEEGEVVLGGMEDVRCTLMGWNFIILGCIGSEIEALKL